MDISPEAVARPQKAASSMPAREEGALLPGSNPHFHHIDRAPYEIGRLLRQMPAQFSQYQEHPAEVYQMADALRDHTHNAQMTLLSGIESIGAVLFSAASSSDGGPDLHAIAHLGCLVQHLAVELQHLDELDYLCDEVVKSRDKFAAAKKGGK